MAILEITHLPRERRRCCVGSKRVQCEVSESTSQTSSCLTRPNTVIKHQEFARALKERSMVNRPCAILAVPLQARLMKVLGSEIIE